MMIDVRGETVKIKGNLRRFAVWAAAVALVVAMIAGQAAAALADGMEIGLADAVGMALRQNKMVLAAESSASALRADARAAFGSYLPKVSLEERYMRTDNPTYAFMSKLNQSKIAQEDFDPSLLNDPSTARDFQTSINVEQLIYSREASMGIAAARKQAEAARFDLERTREDVALGVIKAYLGVITSRQYLEAAAKAVEDATEHQRIAKARYDAGLGLYPDTLRTEVFLKEAQERLISANKGNELAKRGLGLMLGLDAPVDALDEDITYEPGDINAYMDSADGRSDLLAMQKKVEAAGKALSMKKGKHLPVLGLGGSYQLNDESQAFGNEGESYVVMAFLKWNLFDGLQTSNEVASAAHRKREAEQYYEGMKQQVAFKVHDAYLGIEEARLGLELAESRVKLAEESARIVASRYENSLATIVDLLDSQSALNAARADVVAKHNSYMVSIETLKYESGLLLAEYEPGQNGGSNDK